MSHTMDKPTENPEEDTVSLKSNGRTPTNGDAKEALGIMKTFRNSIRRAAEKSPLKGSKVTAKGDESGLKPPPSPSLSSGSPASSPLKNIGGIFQKKEEDEAEGSSQKSKGLPRSKTDPNMTRFGDSLLQRGESIRRSLKLGKKSKDKNCNRELVTVSEGSVEEKEVDKVEEEVVVVEEEIEEAYTLPEIPHTPLSVMQINKLIEMEVLEEAHLNLLALRREFQQEQERCGDDSPMELAKKEKDLSLLYGDLRNKINTIVRDSNSLPSRNKALLVPVARIIQEEERRAEEPGGLSGSWMESWREAVGEGVKVKVESVHLEKKEQNASWLAVHLGRLGKAIVEDLEKVKKELRWSYPPSFKVFSTYVKSYHRVVGQHLKKLERQVTELKDLFALLDWIVNRYKSERIMGSPSLQPDMEDESTDLQLEDDLLRQLKDKYCCRVKEDTSASLDRVTELENKEVWTDGQTPERDDEDLPKSHIDMDIWTNIKGTVVNSRRIDAELEQKVTSSCLQELKQFPKRFEAEFRSHCSARRPQPLWTEYQITYINSFTALQGHMEGYRDACPDEVEAFRKEVKWLIVRLSQDLEDEFKEDVKPFLRRMMTRKWLTSDDDFKQLLLRTDLLSQHCSRMRPPQVQEFASRLHHHVAKEYVGQLMKSNYSCKNRKHEKAAGKIREQWGELRDLFVEMRSTNEWLHPVGDDLSDIITQTNKTTIKEHLQPIVEHYPDFSKKHLVAVLYFRGLLRGREHQLILQRLSELKKKLGDGGGDRSRVLFGDMQVTVNTDCLSNLPFSCLSCLLPDS
ncbi:exocyst complex component 3-like protein 4 [Pagrus major]|uniref:exocyst complex component 3-like protein 4 n=1 Tax=Pagrus major TaxID=143350 RepID=UPI003CC8765B